MIYNRNFLCLQLQSESYVIKRDELRWIALQPFGDALLHYSYFFPSSVSIITSIYLSIYICISLFLSGAVQHLMQWENCKTALWFSVLNCVLQVWPQWWGKKESVFLFSKVNYSWKFSPSSLSKLFTSKLAMKMGYFRMQVMRHRISYTKLTMPQSFIFHIHFDSFQLTHKMLLMFPSQSGALLMWKLVILLQGVLCSLLDAWA